MSASDPVPTVPKILIISRSFPPSNEVGGYRVARFAKYLAEMGWHPVVLTVNADDCPQGVDNSFPVAPTIEIHRVSPARGPVDWYRRLKATLRAQGTSEGPSAAKPAPATASGQVSALRRFVRRTIIPMMQTPDESVLWRSPAIRAGKQLLRSGGFSAIFSSAPPWTSHLVARELSRTSGLPWIADFRDPWTVAVLKKHADKPGFLFRWEQSMERGCMKTASAVVCNTSDLEAALRGRYQEFADKFQTITNGIDDDLADPMQPSSSEFKTLLHLGFIYAGRHHPAFFAALRNLSRRDELGRFRVLLLGGMMPGFVEWLRAEFPDLLESGLVDVQPAIPWINAQKELGRAHGLLIFQGEYTLQVPAKFYEYLSTGKPILALAKPGALTKLLDETRSGVAVAPDDQAAIEAEMAALLDKPANNHGTHLEDFHFRTLTRKLDQLLKTVTASAASRPIAR
jgi:glycosyltransferase involved in cell wall biosynthesis